MNTKYKTKKNILPLLVINIFSFFIGHLSNSPDQEKSISLPSDLGSKNIQLNVKNFYPSSDKLIAPANIFDRKNNLIFSNAIVLEITGPDISGISRATISVNESQLSLFKNLEHEYFHLIPSVSLKKSARKKRSFLSEITI